MRPILSAVKTILTACASTSLFVVTLLILGDLYYRYKDTQVSDSIYLSTVAPYPYVKESYSSAGYNDLQVRKLLRETWPKLNWKYASRLGFQEIEKKGEYVNVSALGFRRNSSSLPSDASLTTDEAEGKQPKRIYFFGGSTTFGYGVPDRDTIPASLERDLRKAGLNANVYNFGRGYYYSLQENDLLDQLLLQGAPKPDLVVFLDGLNERCDIEVYQPQMESIFKTVSSSEYNWKPYEFAKPLILAMHELSNTRTSYRGVSVNTLKCRTKFGMRPLSSVFAHNIDTRKRICSAYGLKCLTFLQPWPGLNNKHLNANIDVEKSIAKKKSLLSEIKLDQTSIFDVSNALSGFSKHAYVDNVHYSVEANGLIGAEMARIIISKQDM